MTELQLLHCSLILLCSERACACTQFLISMLRWWYFTCMLKMNFDVREVLLHAKKKKKTFSLGFFVFRVVSLLPETWSFQFLNSHFKILYLLSFFLANENSIVTASVWQRPLQGRWQNGKCSSQPSAFSCFC